MSQANPFGKPLSLLPCNSISKKIYKKELWSPEDVANNIYDELKDTVQGYF
jgi:hypothetical protein